MTKKALLVFAEGYEDIETIAPIDVLTRVGVEVTTASLRQGPVKGAWGSTLVPHTTLDAVLPELDAFDIVIFPGGKKNAENLAADKRVAELTKRVHSAGKLVAAICAAPSHVLGEAACIVKDCMVTGDPAFSDRLTKSGGLVTGEEVTVDGNVITATGPGSAILFSLHIAEWLVGKDPAKKLAEKWQIPL